MSWNLSIFGVCAGGWRAALCNISLCNVSIWGWVGRGCSCLFVGDGATGQFVCRSFRSFTVLFIKGICCLWGCDGLRLGSPRGIDIDCWMDSWWSLCFFPFVARGVLCGTCCCCGMFNVPPIALHGCLFNSVPRCCYGGHPHPPFRELGSLGVPLSMFCCLCALCSAFLILGKGFISPPSLVCSLSVGLVPCRVWLVLWVLWA